MFHAHGEYNFVQLKKDVNCSPELNDKQSAEKQDSIDTGWSYQRKTNEFIIVDHDVYY